MPGQQPRRGPAEETSLVFVGERRSRRAAELGAHWSDGRLCAKTLHDALRCAGVDPAQAVFLNLFHDEPADGLPCDNALQAVRSLAGTGACIVALGRRVQAALTRAGVAHVGLVHPAARGAIRARAAYQAHVAAVLACAEASPDGRDAVGWVDALHPPRPSDRAPLAADGALPAPA